MAAIALHPVKSASARSVQTCRVGPTGITDDRRWMVVDSVGDMLTAREIPPLLRVVADTPLTAPGLDAPLRLRFPGLESLSIDGSPGEQRSAQVFGRAVRVDVVHQAAGWLQEALGLGGVQLVRHLAHPGERAALQDAAAVSITTTASLQQVSSWADDDLAPSRFRGNLLLSGDIEPFAEDAWTTVRIGDDVVLSARKPISRCLLTTIDPDDLTSGPEPLRSLARHHRIDGTPRFGLGLHVVHGGEISLGDRVTLER
ncbi:MOSC domain-containing protein [Nocardioides sp.]|uniref:MOSC domain-containing protein n=1 Tax=Nocardioides sp. TaxID=35761 RepID=UPI0035119045